ncbi:MAG: glycosyltransferase [Bacteroidota bacterium]
MEEPHQIKRKGLLSVILLSYYSGNRIITTFESLSDILKKEEIDFEFIIVDDGSKDNSFLLASELEKRHKNVRAYQLSRNYTSNYAIFAGLFLCNGDCAIPIPDDEQQPYHTLVEMYRMWENGEQLIIPHRIKRNDGFLTNLYAKTFYRVINAFSDIKYPEGGADTFFIDRELIQIINSRIHPINTSIMSEVLRLGFDTKYYPYERVKSLNKKSRWTFRKKFRQAKDTFFSSSTWPVRFITTLGIFFSLFALAMIVFYTYIRLFGNPGFWGDYLPGWTSTVVIISLFSGLILFSLGIIAEYIWRIYEEVKNRPGYIIKKREEQNETER